MRFVVLFNFLSVVVLLSVANAAAPTGGYAPNATLDPACAPGDADCFVKALGKFVDGTNPLDASYTAGSVGIGTAVPDTELHVAGFGTFDNQVLVDREDDTATRQHIQFRRGTIGSSAYIQTTGDGAGNVVDMRMGMNGLTRMTLLDNGNVGIGTTTPGAELEVAGQVKITGGVPGAGKVLTSDAVGLATWTTPASGADNLGNHTATTNVQLGSNYLSGDGGAEGVAVDATGNVGIGTTSPSHKLTIEGGQIALDNDTGLIMKTSSGNQRRFFNVDATDELAIGNTGSGDGNNSIRFDVTGLASVMRITPSGKVGIGTAAPTHKFNVVDGAASLTYDREGGNSVIRIQTSDNTLSPTIKFNNTDEDWSLGMDGPQGDIFSLGQSGFGSRMVVDTAGNVGVGTTTPGAKLEVNGQVKITGGVPGAGKVLTSDAAGLATWETPASGADNLGNHTATTNVQLGSNYLSGDGDAEGVAVAATGNVGIGTTAPSAKLHVTGGNIFTDGALHLSGIGGSAQEYDIDFSVSDFFNPSNRGLRVKNGVSEVKVLGGNRSHGYGVIEMSGNNSIGSTRGISGWIEGVSSVGAEYSSTRGVMIQNVRQTDNTNIANANLYAWLHNGVAQMTMDNAGNLGIGVTDPAAKLEVNGDVMVSGFAGTYTGGSAYVCVNDSGIIFASETACP